MTAMIMLDDVSPLERIKLSGQLAAQIAAAATATGMERVRVAGTIAGILAKLGAGAPAPFATFEPQKDGSVIVRGDTESLMVAVKAIGGKPKPVADGVRLTAGDARLRQYIPVRIERLPSGAQLEFSESGAVGVRGDFRGGYMGAAAKLSELELYFTQDYGSEEFERVFGKPAPAEGVALHQQEQAEIAARKAVNAARADEQRIDYAKKTGNWAQLSDEEKDALKAESDALSAEFEQKKQAEWEATTGAGVSSNPRYQAYLDTLEDIPAIGRIMVQVGYMAWIQKRLTEYKATGVEPMPYSNGAAKDEWQRKATAFVREWADQHLSERVKARRALASGRAPAGGTIGMNGEFYKGGSFLPNTTLPKQGKAPGGAGAATGVLIEPGLRADAPAPGYGSIFANYREFIDVTDGVASVVNRPDAAVGAYVNEDVAEGRAFLRAAADAYNAGMRWFKPGEIEVGEEHRVDPEAPAFEVIEHTTGRGKVIRGIVRTDLSYAEAKAIDEYTFKKSGGYFIREKHLEAMGLPPAPPAPTEPVDPIRQAELDAEREQQRLQAEADRLANEQARQRQKLEQQVSKLRSVAASTLEKAEQELGRDRLANTSRRAAMAASGIAAAERSRALALTMNNLADAIERGQAQHLAGISSRADVETLTERLNGARYEYERAKGISSMDRERRKHEPITTEEVRYATFPDPKWDSAGARRSAILDMIKGKRGGPAIAEKIRYASSMTAEHVKALRDLLGKKEVDAELGWWNVEQLTKVERLKRAGITNTLELRDALAEFLEFREGARAEDPITKAERAIIGQKVGIDFFPTPKALAARMADLAGVSEGDRVLEPSAGNGNLADAAKAAGGQVDVIEISSQLRDILTAKGYEVVAHDFDAFTPSEPYDAVIMNPPFSNRRDAEHIMRAFGMLKPGGRLAAIAGEGVFFGTDAKAVAFRKWLDDHGADIEPLGAGTFKDTSLLATTGANARLIVIHK